MWISRVNGWVEVDGEDGMGAYRETECGDAAELQWSGGHSVCRKLESAQMGRRLLGASNAVAGMAVQGDLGWKKLEERREEMKVVFGKRLERMKES